jgi:hypothetical protein
MQLAAYVAVALMAERWWCVHTQGSRR